jgi:hypothetical protein
VYHRDDTLRDALRAALAADDDAAAGGATPGASHEGG